MTAFAERAQCEKEGEPSCLDWLIGDSNDPPDHVCDVIAQASTAVFAAERDLYGHLYPPRPTQDLGALLNPPPSVHAYVSNHEYINSWPLPIGKGAIAEWYRLQNTMRHDKGEWSPLIVTSSVLVTQDNAWLGLAAWRMLGTGTAWLLGLVERVQGLVYFLPPTTEQLPTWWASEDEQIRAVNVIDAGGNRPYARHELWRWAAPVVLTEAHAHTRADLDALTAAVRPLLGWYREALLGKTFRTGGPPPLFTTQDQCRTAVVNVYRALLRNNPRPTRSLVAQWLGYTESGLRKRLARFGLKWKDLVAEARAGK